MKNIFICLLIALFCNISNAQNNTANKDAKKIFKKHLSTIKKYFSEIDTEKGYSNDENNDFDKATKFLVLTTHLDCFDYSFIGCEPKKEDYENWKSWYKLNKKKLYIENGKVKTDNPTPLVKKPVKYFKSKLKLVKKSIKKKVFEEPEYFDAIYFLRKITKTQKNSIDHRKDIDIPTVTEIKLFKNWLKQNKGSLYWDTNNLTVNIKN